MALPGYMKKDKNTLLFNGDGELVYYVPEKYFSNKSAEIIGDEVELMGIFDYEVFSKTGSGSGKKNFNFPTVFKCRPTSIEKVAEFQINKKSEPVPYRLLHFKKGAELVCSTLVPQSVKNVEKFMKLLIGGNLPNTIPYSRLHEYTIKNAALNGFSYKISAQIFGVVISELCRSTKDPTKPFRLAGTNDYLDYVFMNIKKIPKYTSAFTSITSENADEAIANAITNKTHKDSALEKVMMN